MNNNSSSSGLFITFEGGEGTGKTTQIQKLKNTLEDKEGLSVIVTREPGGCDEAEKIRELLVQRDGGDWSAISECLLLYAGRYEHVNKVIKPALEAGKIVISDRFSDSTMAYQGYGRGLSKDTISSIHRLVLGQFEPDISFIFDMDVQTGLMRAEKRLASDLSHEDRFERMDIEFHENLRRGFIDIAENCPDRCHVINADRDIEEIAQDIFRITREKIGRHVI
jgi:dTMP kinase